MKLTLWGKYLMGLLIPDGYTLDGLLPARPGLHGEVRFKYRPALPERVSEFLKSDRSTAPKDMAVTVKLLGEQLVSWEDDAPLGEASFRRLLYPDLVDLVDHVTGYKLTDWTSREKN